MKKPAMISAVIACGLSQEKIGLANSRESCSNREDGGVAEDTAGLTWEAIEGRVHNRSTRVDEKGGKSICKGTRTSK